MNGAALRRTLAIVGAGPAGLLAALRGAQLGFEIELYASGVGRPVAPLRVECVPAQFVALLMELGVDPRRVGVDELHETRCVQWGQSGATTFATPRSAHVARPALEHVLTERVATAGIELTPRRDGLIEALRLRARSGDCVVIDASGRSAATVETIIRPRRPMVARTFSIVLDDGEPLLDRRLMLAASPSGYAYRLGTSGGLLLGLVGHRNLVGTHSDEALAKIGEFAPWMVDDLRGCALEPGASGAASVQWASSRSGEIVLVGDAAFARDAISSQGLAIGAGDALRLVTAIDRDVPHRNPHDIAKAVATHCARIAWHIEASPFGTSEGWREYAAFLKDHIPDPVPGTRHVQLS